MKDKGKRIEALEQEVERLRECLDALTKERQELGALRQEVRSLRRELDDYARKQQELAWHVQNRRDGSKKKHVDVPVDPGVPEKEGV